MLAYQCYLCHKKKCTLAFIKRGYKILRCNNCGLFFLDFKQDYNQFVKHYYSKGYFTGDASRCAYADYKEDEPMIIKNMKKYLQHVLSYKRNGNLLDIGCAYGYFLEIAGKHFDVFGIDVSDYAIKIARMKFADKVRLSDIANNDFKKNSFDVITMWDVLEHLENPIKNLKIINGLLKKDGVLGIQTADAGSIWRKIMGKKWHFFNPPQHLFYFSKKTLNDLLSQTGFKVVKYDYVGKWVYLRYILHLASSINDDKIALFFHKLISPTIFGKISIYLKRSDNIIVFAKKR